MFTSINPIQRLRSSARIRNVFIWYPKLQTFVRSNAHKDCLVPIPARLKRKSTTDNLVTFQFNAEVEDAPNLLVLHFARQTVLHDAISQHFTRLAERLKNRHGVAVPCQLIGTREPRRSCPTTATFSSCFSSLNLTGFSISRSLLQTSPEH